MAKQHCSAHAEGVAAPQQNRDADVSFECKPLDFFRAAIDLFGGPTHGLHVGVISSAVDGDLVEICGSMPSALLAGLRRASADWEQPVAGSVQWRDVSVVLHTTRDGYGPRYAIPGLGALADLLAERQLALQGGLATRPDGTAWNPGVEQATRAAKAVNGAMAVPQFDENVPGQPTDFNDLHAHRGLEAVRSAIDMSLNPATPILPVWLVPPTDPADLQRASFPADVLVFFNETLAQRVDPRGVVLRIYDGRIDGLRDALAEAGRLMPSACIHAIIPAEIAATAANLSGFSREVLEPGASWVDGLWASVTARTGLREPEQPVDDGSCEQKPATHVGPAPTEILLEPGELTRIVDWAERALLARAPNVYTRAGRIVRPIRVPTTIADGKTADITQIKPLAKHALVEELTKVASWIKSDARRREGHDRVRVNCPLPVAETLLARDQWSLRPLTAIINGPTLRPDGTVLEVPGYDQATGLLLEPHAAFAPVPQQPSRDDALAALARLGDIVRKFPFVGPADKSVWFAALFTAAIRRSLPTAPMFAFSAPSAGTGKSYMADLVAIITTGERSPVLAQGSNEEETEKRLGGVLLAGHTIVNIDNCTDAIEGDFLCQLLTQPIVQVRKLGGSDVCRVPGSSTMMATGNNLVIAGDMTRRALLCRLDAGVEQPELRVFDFDPLEKAQLGRSAYLVDVLTILRAFHVAGRPTKPKPLGSFEVWSSWVRGALLWLGMADPCDVMERSRKADPALSNLREVLHGLHKAFGNRQVVTREIIERATTQASFGSALAGGKEFENPDLREALLAVAGAGGAINGNRLGKWLAAHRDRPVDGMRLIEVGMNRAGVKLWLVASGDQSSF